MPEPPGRGGRTRWTVDYKGSSARFEVLAKDPRDALEDFRKALE
jgi:hypothetical protein